MSTDFLKLNQTKYSDALLQEAEGLDTIRALLVNHQIHEITVPRVKMADKRELVLERIFGQVPNEHHMHMLGIGLAKLHKAHAGKLFGLEHDNYIGLNPQPNILTTNWGAFFAEQRLAYQISLITDSKIKSAFARKLEQHRPALTTFLNAHCEKPSLCHGDLWSGNAMFTDARCWLIDPAAYYADREVDIAMTEMFGGFTQAFYRAYNTAYPVSQAYPIKKQIFNLYHYLNHYNLFGEGYLSACNAGFDLLASLPER